MAEFYLNAVQANVDKAWNGLEAVEKVKEQPNKYSVIFYGYYDAKNEWG